MKRQRRKGVHETNSSSTHALCISKQKTAYKIPLSLDFKIDEFGWENDVYSDTWSKASYLITGIFDVGDKDISDKYLKQLEGILYDAGISYNIPKPSVSSYEWRNKQVVHYDISGWIDHASCLTEWLDDVLSDKDKLFESLFGDAFIVTGNDNSDTFDSHMYESKGIVHSKWGDYEEFGDLKPEFAKYDVYIKGN